MCADTKCLVGICLVRELNDHLERFSFVLHVIFLRFIHFTTLSQLKALLKLAFPSNATSRSVTLSMHPAPAAVASARHQTAKMRADGLGCCNLYSGSPRGF